MRSCTHHKSCGNKLVKAAQTAPGKPQGDTTLVVEEEYITPLVDIIENDDEFIIVADMPGASSDGIDVKFDNGELSIYGQADVDSEEEAEDIVFRCHQFEPGNYFRNFRIGESINPDAISADYADGVLTVHLPKREEIQPRKINVAKKS